MGTFNKGILGPFNGKVGTVIGSTWKGRWVMRSLPSSVHNPRTESQQANRAAFKVVGLFAKALNPVARYGLANTANASQVTPYNACVSINMSNGSVQGEGTTRTLDYTKVSISQGEGVPPGSPSATMEASQSLSVTWTDNSGISPETLARDNICVAAYNESRNALVYDVSTATRGDESLTLNCPALWTGEEAQVFLFTQSADGKIVSPTIYLGSVTVS